MKLTDGIAPLKILAEFGFANSVVGVALNAKQEVVECISYDATNDDARKGVFTSMIYNGWIEEGKKQSAYKFSSPNELWNNYTFKALRTEEEKTEFLSAILPIPESEQEDLNHMVETGRGVMVKNKQEAAGRYPHLFAYGLIYFDGFGPSIKLKVKEGITH